MNVSKEYELLLASENGNFNVVKNLVEIENIKIDTKDEDGETPLFLALGEGHLDIASLLLEKKADISVKTVDQTDILMNCIYSDDIKVVEYIFSKYPDLELNNQDIEGMTPLHISIELCNFEIFSLLIKKNAHVNIFNNSGDAPLHTAVTLGLTEFVKTLIGAKAETKLVNDKGNTPQKLAEYLKDNAKEIIELLKSN